MYSEESIAETLTAQAEVLANGVLGWVNANDDRPKCLSTIQHIEKFLVFFFPLPIYSVNFKKNEKAYNSEGSEVLKALKETENDPREPGNKCVLSDFDFDFTVNYKCTMPHNWNACIIVCHFLSVATTPLTLPPSGIYSAVYANIKMFIIKHAFPPPSPHYPCD